MSFAELAGRFNPLRPALAGEMLEDQKIIDIATDERFNPLRPALAGEMT